MMSHGNPVVVTLPDVWPFKSIKFRLFRIASNHKFQICLRGLHTTSLTFDLPSDQEKKAEEMFKRGRNLQVFSKTAFVASPSEINQEP